MEAPGQQTTHQMPGTVDVTPMAGVQPETQGETEEGEPPYKAPRSGDIVMVIDGETPLRARGGCTKGLFDERFGSV